MIAKQVVKLAVNGRWRGVLEGLGVNGGLLKNTHGACPGCGGRDRFRFDDLGGDGTFLCSQGGGELLVGDGFRLVEHVRGCDWREGIALVARAVGLDPEGVQWRQERGTRLGGEEEVVPEPVAPKGSRALDMARVADFVRGVPEVTDEFLRRRSPVDPVGVTAGKFLEAVFRPEERVLVFTEQWSQGDYLGWVGHGRYRLASQRGVQGRRSHLPKGGKKGVWYLVQPVTGQWAINPRRSGDGEARWTRRSEVNVEGWRHFVLESDVPGHEGAWRKVLAVLRVPVVALYTSGGRSIHALVRCEVGSKAMWDATRDALAELVCPLGADPGALSAVRLSRLPGCLREGKDVREVDGEGKKTMRYVAYKEPQLQRLLYLNPAPEHEAIWMKREVRA